MIKINWLLTIIAVLLVVMFSFIAYVIGYLQGSMADKNIRYEQESIQMTEIIKQMDNATLKIGQNSQGYVTVQGVVSEKELIQLKQLLQAHFGNTYPFVYRLDVEVKDKVREME